MRRSLLLTALCLLLAGAAGPRDVHAARDVVSAEAPPVGPFHRLVVSGHAELILVQGTREAVVVEASPSDRTRVRVRSSDGTVTIDAGGNRAWWDFGGIVGRAATITVHFRTLDSLSMSGAIKVSAESIAVPTLRVSAAGATSMNVAELKVDTLRFDGSGAVKGEFAGTAADQEIRISGAGAYRAPKLVSETASVSVSGAGKVVVNVQKKLGASISGAGAIDYYGDPQLSQRVSGAGKIRQRSPTSPSPTSLRSV